jgi:cysteine desulfurase
MGIYLDHNATTPVRPEVVEAMRECWGMDSPLRNPSSVHKLGRQARARVAQARAAIAEALGAQPSEIVFTGGGSEAINLALKGVYFASEAARPHIVTTQIEHPAVLQTCRWLERRGCRVTYVPVDNQGMAYADEAIAAIGPDTILVSVMHANNEVGTIQPVCEIGAAARERGVPFHVDAVQTVGKVPVSVDELNCDLLSASAHKIHGPQGVGALYVREGTLLEPLIHGGGQERGLRAGTENVPGICGFAEAVRLALEEMDANRRRSLRHRAQLLRLLRELPAVHLNGHPTQVLPHTVSLSFMYIDGMALALNLSLRGIYVSNASACHSHSLEPSHVLLAMGLTERAAHGAVRFSLGASNTDEEIDTVVEEVLKLVAKLRIATAPEDIGQCKDDCPCFTDPDRRPAASTAALRAGAPA